ncbi:MAG TPA: thioredoxin family protein [Planctomycetaceae bacterium]|jgi:thioredoxin-related protein|nr:thioredoxin family protein [Planctomycetaceae bacterium]
MKQFLLLLLWFSAALCTLRVEAAGPAAGPPWIRDFAAGQRKARAEGKELFVLLTGHGWCYNCELLDREVFQKPEFVRHVSPDFVLIEIDFTYGESQQEKQRERVDRQLQKRFLAPGVPVVLLLDREGVPYAYAVDGYDRGTGPQKILKQIDAARAARARRDREFAAAQKLSGPERARRLHAGLAAVTPWLGTLKDHGDDALLAFYPKVITEIRQLDAAGGRLADFYNDRQKIRDRWIAENDATYGKLKEFDRKQDYKGAIKFIDAALKQPATPELNWQLERARQVYLEWDGQYEAALKNARRLLADPNLVPDEREFLLGRESFNLFNTGRVEEAVSQMDQRIQDAGISSAKRLRLLSWKAQMLLSHRKMQGVTRGARYKAWTEFRQAAPPKSDDWSTATALLGRQYMLDGDFRQALPLIDEFLKVTPDNAWVLLDAAECEIGLGHKDTAREKINAAEKSLPAYAVRQDEKDFAKRVYDRIAKLQDKLKQQPK